MRGPYVLEIFRYHREGRLVSPGRGATANKGRERRAHDCRHLLPGVGIDGACFFFVSHCFKEVRPRLEALTENRRRELCQVERDKGIDDFTGCCH